MNLSGNLASGEQLLPAAFMAIRNVIFDRKKEEIIEQRFQEWTEKSGDAIRERLPQHLKFAEYYIEVIESDPLSWTAYCRN